MRRYNTGEEMQACITFMISCSHRICSGLYDGFTCHDRKCMLGHHDIGQQTSSQLVPIKCCFPNCTCCKPVYALIAIVSLAGVFDSALCAPTCRLCWIKISSVKFCLPADKEYREKVNAEKRARSQKEVRQHMSITLTSCMQAGTTVVMAVYDGAVALPISHDKLHAAQITHAMSSCLPCRF